jgi:hypothetical protein
MSLVRNTVVVFAILFGMFLGISGSIRAQGFNWQYSSRLPSGYPVFFVGVVGNAMQSRHSATMRYVEDVNGKQCDCQATFSQATSYDFTGGIIAEYWLPEANIAVYGILQAEQRNAIFVAKGRELPVSPILGGKNFTTNYTLSTTTLNATIEAGLKVKVSPLPLFATIGLQASSNLTKEFSLQEQSAENFSFSASNLPTTFVTLNPFVVGAKASIGADFSLTKSMYVSPALFASVPFWSLTLEPSMWSRLSYGVQVSVLLGFMP